MSQRERGFNGGIETGTSATGSESRGTEKLLRKAAADVRVQIPGVSWQSGFGAGAIVQRLGVRGEDFEIAGAYPDGGVWLDERDGIPLVAAEAKHQGACGNAIERWFKNHCTLKALGVSRSVTICTGDGFFENNGAQRTMQLALALDAEERHRCESGEVWNVQAGRIWLYRFRTARDAEAFDLEGLLTDAVRAALAER